eukprot:gnl/MRDRNA2_/MRDRNA2_78705_c0_seq1.p1 gnl/MRDRNA2_/MRDRNA2_78705_c0~~gnl/MRDRNA2_/MRDRNA2_78705_c0_seq1.p1  ORF type:complete len:534 (-),score=75.03 gnl/MRDRNA2_/MRDRNA2_78705_c0_seq1:767-2368(-)
MNTQYIARRVLRTQFTRLRQSRWCQSMTAEGPPGMTKADENQAITKTLAEYTMSLKYHQLRSEVVEVSKHCLLDWIGVTIAGVEEPLTQMLIEQADVEGGNAQASLIGDGRKVSASQAALINGSASHALDYDDVHSRLHGHPTVPVAPVVFALAEKNNACGQDLLTAFAAGVEAECRIGAYVGMTHYEKGWHNTATLGTFGAAVAAAHMLRLSSEQCALAMGIAGTSAAGLKCMFGTMCKPLHAGKAAQNGLFAAEMAARGFTARPDVLERPQGFASTQSEQTNIQSGLHGLGTHFEVSDTLFKYHAACYGTHAMIEAIHSLQRSHAEVIDLETVTKLEVTVQTPFLNVCAIPNPVTGLEGKFSLRFCAALALAGKDTARLENYTDESVADPRFVEFLDKVVVTGTERLEKMEAEVTIHLKSGTTLNAKHDAGVPATNLGEQWEKLARKFRACTEHVIGKRKAEKVIEAVRTLEVAQPEDISALVQLCCNRKMARPIVVMDGATGSQLFHWVCPAVKQSGVQTHSLNHSTMTL